MTQDPSHAPSSSSSPAASSSGSLPPVDQVIYDIRESSGTLRTPEAPDTLIATASAGAPEAPDTHDPEPKVAAAASRTAEHAAHATSAAPDTHDAHGEAHEHGEELGPIDWPNWGAGALGVALALVMTVCFAIATQGLGAY